MEGVFVDEYAAPVNRGDEWSTCGWFYPGFTYNTSAVELNGTQVGRYCTFNYSLAATDSLLLCDRAKRTYKLRTYSYSILERVVQEYCSCWVDFNAVFSNITLVLLSKSVPTERYTKRHMINNPYSNVVWHVSRAFPSGNYGGSIWLSTLKRNYCRWWRDLRHIASDGKNV